MLNEYEKNKFDIISKVVSKEITIKEAMDKLNLTERQIYRLKKIYIEHGEKGFIHKNRGKENPNKIIVLTEQFDYKNNGKERL